MFSPARFIACLSFIILVALFPYPAATSSQPPEQSEEQTIAIEHKPVSAIPANRLAEIAVAAVDKQGIREVRLYLKTMARPWYVFKQMARSGKNRYATSLPPAKNDSRGIDYLFVVTNSAGKSFKTKPYRVLVQNDYRSQPIAEIKTIKVYAEIANPPERLNDFLFPLIVSRGNNALLTKAVQYHHTPINVPGPGRPRGATSFWGGLGGVAATITLGGVGISYRSN